ncbi:MULTISPECIES: metal ABC transporter substrate-binding protein [unclassified Arthrobacter]|uniref:metal ABC transporter substrate-binding protein n=1 Tax=unclassified Arthrobacter TaxID=235627 RepID=UPI000464EBCE|nr:MULTISPECIES: metal ABC transporter substrate-binding protein [unclassified Arthrobacter]PVE14771.1 zinc ABC transporter substrate-binding protein [Arthrobacter sp. Bz4]
MRRLIPSFAVLTLAIAGCGVGEDAGTAGESSEGQLRAVAAVYPLAWMAEEIAPDVEIEFLGSGSAEAHELELTPGQREALETSDVVLYMGDIGYQSQVEDAAGAAGGEIVDVSEVAGEDRMLAASEDAHAHAEEEGGHSEEEEEHAEGEEEHAEEGGHAEEESTEGALDPHVWFDASIMAEVALRTGEAFAAADPDNAETYTGNAERVSEELMASHGEIEQLLSQACQFEEAIVSHAAYGYLLEPFGYTQHAVVGVTSGEAGASGGELAEIVAEIEEEGFEYVLAEPVEGRADAEAVVGETGTEMLDIFPLDVVSEEQMEQGYPALLQEQAEAFSTALNCT